MTEDIKKSDTTWQALDSLKGIVDMSSREIVIGNNLLRLCYNGDIYVRGILCENNKEIVDAAAEFFLHQRKFNEEMKAKNQADLQEMLNEAALHKLVSQE